jgi:hypothetical protein
MRTSEITALREGVRALFGAIIVQACVDYVRPKRTYEYPKGNVPMVYTNKYMEFDRKDADNFLHGERLPLYIRFSGLNVGVSKIASKKKVKEELDKIHHLHRIMERKGKKAARIEAGYYV